MKSWILLFALASIALSFSSSSYDDIILRTVWVPSDCFGHPTCQVYPKFFKFWPIHVFQAVSSADGSSPTNCTGSPFDLDRLALIRPELDQNWPDPWAMADPTGFWAQIWNKDGKCVANAFSSQLEFFRTGLSLLSTVDIYPVLAEEGIIPSSTRTYTAKDFDSVMWRHFGVLPSLKCKLAGGKNYIHNIDFCYSLKTLMLVDCSAAIRSLDATGCGADPLIYLDYKPNK